MESINRVSKLMISTDKGFIVEVTETDINFTMYHLFDCNDDWVCKDRSYTEVFEAMLCLNN